MPPFNATTFPTQASSAGPWESGRAALFAAAAAFVTAFGLTLALSAPDVSSRSLAGPRLEPFAGPLPAQSVTRPVPRPSAVEVEPLAAPAVARSASRAVQASRSSESSTAPREVPTPPRRKQARAVQGPSSVPAKGKDLNAVLRRYGI